MSSPGLLHRFTIEVDGLDLGAFTECRGLQATYTLKPALEGGSLSPSAQLLESVVYGDVTLSRPLDGTSGAVAAWFSSFAGKPAPTTARISALGADGETVCAWDLQGVVPRQWTGPQWHVETSKVAVETLTLAHTGFAAG